MVNDGELGKTNFTNYVRERLSGFEQRETTAKTGGLAHSISARELDLIARRASRRSASTSSATSDVLHSRRT